MLKQADELQGSLDKIAGGSSDTNADSESNGSDKENQSDKKKGTSAKSIEEQLKDAKKDIVEIEDLIKK